MSGLPYELIKISESSFLIEENGVRSFLFIGAKKAMLVDTGYGSGDLKSVVESVTKLPLILVNTHADGDHIGCNGQFETAFMHPAEFDRFNSRENGRGAVPAAIWERDKIDIGGYVFEVILIPGHTPGSIALLDEEHGLLIAGDSVQAGMIYMTGAGRNVPAYIESMKKLSCIAGKIRLIYPAHGPFPVHADIFEGLIKGAEDLCAGKLIASDAPFETNAKVYDAGVAKFLY